MSAPALVPELRVKRYKRLIIGFGTLVFVVVLSGLLAVFWLPGYAKSQLEIRLSELLQRQVTIASIEIRPHTLELVVSDFRIVEKTDSGAQQQTFLSFAKLHLDLSAESLRYRAPVVTSVTLVEPKIRVVRHSREQFNFSDLLEKFHQPALEEETKEPAKFSIANIAIQNGRIEFDDQWMKADHQVTEINLGIPIVANFDSALTNWIEPHFSGKINGAAFSLDGKLRAFTENQEASLTFKLDRFDLSRVDQYAALPSGVALLSGYLDSELTVTFAQSPDKALTVMATGRTSLEQLSIENSAVEMPYRMDLKRLSLVLSQVDLTDKKPSQVKLDMNQIALTRVGESKPVLQLAKLIIDQVTINNAQRKIALGEMTVDQLQTSLQRDASGNIDLVRLFNTQNTQTPDKSINAIPNGLQRRAPTAQATIPIPLRKPLPSNSAENTQLPKASALSGNKQVVANNNAWATQISRINLKSATITYQDLTLKKIMPMVVDSLDLTLREIDLNGVKPLKLAMKGRVNQKGAIHVEGALAWNPILTDLAMNLEAVDIVSLQGWAGDRLTVLLTSGDISFDGKIKVDGEPTKIYVNGHGMLANFNILDAGNSQDLLRWKKLDISNLNFVNDPLRIDIRTIGLHDYFARLAILPNGDLNLKHIVRQGKVETENPMPASVTSPAPVDTKNNTAPTASSDKGTPVFIDKIVLQHGNINFHDRFIKPNYRANLTGLSGQIGPLHPGRAGKVEIVGALDKTAPLEIRGTIDPFSTELSLDITTKVKDIDLPPLTPYSAKYVGYEIEKGKLSADVSYRIEKGTLTAQNNIFLDQFTLGKEVSGENAVSLPLDLAIALLKNRRGEIDIRLPLQGSLDDPQFNLGDVIFTAFVNLITKAITSPFALLGSVFEHGEELSEITFIPGFSDIEAEAADRLRTLAEVLDDRSSLKLEIIGHYDPNLDVDGLKLAMLQNKVKVQKLAADAERGVAGGTLEDVTLSREEYDSYLKVAYKRESFEKPRNAIGLTKDIPGDEMERLILANIVINENDLKELAGNRAIVARNWLIEHGEISSDRIFIMSSHENGHDDSKKGSRVEFVLK